MSSAPPIRVMIVDDHAVVRQGVSAMLDVLDDIDVVATATDVAEAIDRCAVLQVEVVLMDMAMPGIDGARGTALLLDRHPDLRVVILTGFVDEAAVRAAMAAGASACLLKTVGVTELADSIRGVMHGRSTFSSEFLPHLVGESRDEGPTSDLTPRERDILALLADGQTNRGIAEGLGLSEGTVRIYVSTILTKLGATNRTEATVVAIRRGLVDEPR